MYVHRNESCNTACSPAIAAAPLLQALTMLWTLQQLAPLLQCLAQAKADPCCCPPEVKAEVANAVPNPPEPREPRESGGDGGGRGDAGGEGGGDGGGACGGSDNGGGACGGSDNGGGNGCGW